MALRRLSVASLVLLPLLVWLLLKSVFVSREERIKRVVHGLVEACEKGN